MIDCQPQAFECRAEIRVGDLDFPHSDDVQIERFQERPIIKIVSMPGWIVNSVISKLINVGGYLLGKGPEGATTGNAGSSTGYERSGRIEDSLAIALRIAFTQNGHGNGIVQLWWS